jgi:hypothetical protein
VATADVHAAAAGPEHPQLRKHRGAAANVGADRCAGHTHFRERPDSENQQRAHGNVDCVAEPQHSHRQRRIAGASENRVVEEQQRDGSVGGEHHLRVAKRRLDHRPRSAHRVHQALGVEVTGDTDRRRDDYAQDD